MWGYNKEHFENTKMKVATYFPNYNSGAIRGKQLEEMDNTKFLSILEIEKTYDKHFIAFNVNHSTRTTCAVARKYRFNVINQGKSIILVQYYETSEFINNMIEFFKNITNDYLHEHIFMIKRYITLEQGYFYTFNVTLSIDQELFEALKSYFDILILSGQTTGLEPEYIFEMKEGVKINGSF